TCAPLSSVSSTCSATSPRCTRSRRRSARVLALACPSFVVMPAGSCGRHLARAADRRNHLRGDELQYRRGDLALHLARPRNDVAEIETECGESLEARERRFDGPSDGEPIDELVLEGSRVLGLRPRVVPHVVVLAQL